MTNNDIFKRIRSILGFNDTKIAAVFAHTQYPVTQEQFSNWLKKEEDPQYKQCEDTPLAAFLNGLIIEKRGKKEGPLPQPEDKLTNNIIFMKLKIAFNLQGEGVLNILALADFKMSNHELSALFRRPGHKHYRVCQDQVLRKFLEGAHIKYHEKLVASN
jgi:uncharacterized protein YehS (DUF1456 family)